MRIGPLEIITIIVIIIAVVLIARTFRAKPDDNSRDRESSAEISSGQRKDVLAKIQGYLRRLGIALVIAGILFALAGISMFRWALQGYVWAFIAMVLGFAILFLSRKK